MRPPNRSAPRHAAIAGLAAFAAALGAAAGSSLAQNNDKGTILEILRKAASRESEAGFCATTGWRLETAETHDSNIVIYDT